MKKTFFILTLMFSSLIANALTVDKLLKYYRNQPDIQYEEMKGKELKALMDSVSSDVENNALRSARKLVILGTVMDEEQREQLVSMLNNLNDYSLALAYTKDVPEPLNPLLFTVTGPDSSITVDIYSRNSSSSEYLIKPVFLINMCGMVAFVYLDGKIRPDTAKEFVEVTFNTSYFFSASPEQTGKKQGSLDRIDHQLNIYPQEKIHVVTDRDLYCGGDTIWLRAFVVDADSHIQTAISKYAYVELLTPFGFADKRVKLMERDGVYAGYIPIDEEIYEGDYTLTAYTAYAENQGKDYFFRKPLRILAPKSSKYVIDSEFTSSGEGKVKGLFKIRSLTGDPINYKVMSLTMPDGGFLELPHAKKGISRKFSRDKGEDVVLVKFGDYGRYFPVDYPVEKTDLTFYPEGGWLIADQPCTVAFKATDENGKAQPRTAEIGSAKSGAVSLRYGSAGSKGTFSVVGGDGQELELVISLRGAGVFVAPISSTTPSLSTKPRCRPDSIRRYWCQKPTTPCLANAFFSSELTD